MAADRQEADAAWAREAVRLLIVRCIRAVAAQMRLDREARRRQEGKPGAAP